MEDMTMRETSILTSTEMIPVSPKKHEDWKEDIVKVINVLNNQERLVIALHYHEGLSPPEIAQVLDIPISKVNKIYDKTLKEFINY
jgi:RNA polymerase sigma factor (sigma-70 family)